MDEDAAVAAELARISAASRSTWTRRFALMIVPAAVIGGGIGALVKHAHGGGAYRDTPFSFAACGVFVTIMMACLPWLSRRFRLLDRGLPPLVLGLPRAKRREVAKNVRRGTPSSDPVLRAVELHTVERIRAQSLILQWVYPAAAVFIGLAAVLSESLADLALKLLACGLFLLGWVLLRRLRSQADRYLS